MNSRPTPIFLFSLPRSGSTMAQRVLATNEQISTASEPWVLLPYLRTLRSEGNYADYGHNIAVQAIRDFCRTLPEGEENYLSAVRELVLQLYGRAADGEARYFLDKTPRYHLVVEDIIDLFPDGKFIFLWRNPLSIVASMMETWANGLWKPYLFKVDLFHGIENLIRAYERHSDRVYAVQYEELIGGASEQWERIFDYLEIPFSSHILRDFQNVKLAGGMGDPTGSKVFTELSEQSISKWKQSLFNPIRKTWCRRYLHWIGRERLAVMGYDLGELLAELDNVPLSSQRLGSDLLRSVYGPAYQLFELEQVKHNLRLLPDWSRVNVHR